MALVHWSPSATENGRAMSYEEWDGSLLEGNQLQDEKDDVMIVIF